MIGGGMVISTSGPNASLKQLETLVPLQAPSARTRATGVFDPGDQFGQRGFVADLICGQQRGDDLAAVRIISDV